MAIVTLAEMKAELTIDTSNNKDDVLIQRRIDAAGGFIQTHTRRRFEPVTATRLLGATWACGALLKLDDDLLSATAIVDGTGKTLTPADYRLEPRGYPPYGHIRALASIGNAWLFNPDGEVSVTGSWGWSATLEPAIKQAAMRLAVWLYRQRDTSEDADRPIASEGGVMLMPNRVPKDIMDMITPFVRRR